MSYASSGKQIFVESHREEIGACGFEVTMMRRQDRLRGGAFILLKGGLGDINSVSLRPLAEAIIEASDGEVGVGTVSTIRPCNPIVALQGLKDARKQRSQSMLGAMKYVNGRHQPDVLITGGQSQGGIQAVDSPLHLKTKSRNPGRQTSLGAVTIDAPGVYGPFVTGMHVIEGLIRLAGNCLPDIMALSWHERMELVRDNLRHPHSLFEPAYIAKEIEYMSKEIDISPDIAALRRNNVYVKHAFHRGDIVPGAEIPSEHSRVFDGAHVRIVHEPEPVAEYMVDFAGEILANSKDQNAA